MNRRERTEVTYAALFGPRDPAAPEDDPELMEILRGVIFGDVFHIGSLDHRTRELITVVLLTTMQTLPQLRAHTLAALNSGATPTEIREAVYLCAPFIGFPRTLNAAATMNEAFRSRGIELPLPPQGTVGDPGERFERGRALQEPRYGSGMRDSLEGLPDGLAEAVSRLLIEFGFGDFDTRGGLVEWERELLILCVLTALGGTEVQLRSHTRGNLVVGNDARRLVEAMIHCAPYVGFPRAITAIRIIRDVSVQAEPG